VILRSFSTRFSLPLAVARKAAWALFLVSLPVTSFPYFPEEMGGVALVRPLSLYPLVLLLVLFTLPTLFSKRVPKTLLTLVPFALIALVSSLLSITQDIDPVLGVSVTARTLRALITLGIGCAIYYTVALFPQSFSELRLSLRWLYLGFMVALLWGSLQAVYVISFDAQYYKWLKGLQAYISTRTLFTNRISGMTYEPNWFAEQISVLLMPWLLASTLSGYSAFRWRWRWLTVELFLLAWAVVILVFTFSRAGLGNLIGLLAIGILFLRPRRPAKSSKPHTTRWLWLRRLLEAGLVIAILIGLLYTASTRSPFLARMWDYWTEVKETSLRDYFDYVGFGARLMYAEAAFDIYDARPVLGIGLGNYAFYVKDALPDSLLAKNPEILRILTPEIGRNRLVTPKNFYLRILAETGLVGAAAFIAFLVALLGCVLALLYSRPDNLDFWGKAGVLALIAFGIGAISFDSFAIPNIWVNFGFITAATWIAFQAGGPDRLTRAHQRTG